MEETKRILKLCINSRPGGVPQEELDDEFFKFTGYYIPYLSLGYNSLYDYMGTIKEIVKKRDANNQLIYVVDDPNLDNLGSLNTKLSDLNL